MAKFGDFGKKPEPEVTIEPRRNPILEQATYEPPYAETVPETINMNILQNNLGHCLDIIEDEVMKGYVTRLDQLPIIRSDTYIEKDMQNIQFFKISELVYQEDGFSVDKLAMVFHTLLNKPCTLALLLKSDGEKVDFYLGARPSDTHSAGTLVQMLKQSLLGFFPGSRIEAYYDEDMKKDMNELKVGCISCVTCIADYKQDEEAVSDKDFIQGLEKYIYAMRGKCYTAIFIADSMEYDELMFRKREYEQIYTQVSPFANMQMNFTVSDGKSMSTGDSEGIAKSTAHTKTAGVAGSDTKTTTLTTGSSETTGITDTDSSTYTTSDSVADGKTHTIGTSDGTNSSVTDGTYTGVYAHAGGNIGPVSIGGGVNSGRNHSVSKGTSHTDSVSDSVSRTLTHGFSDAKGRSHSDSRTLGKNNSESTAASLGISVSESNSDTLSETFSLVNTKTMTESFGSSKGVTLNAQNMTLNLALQRMERHLDRIEECESFGMWNFAAYFLGESAAETETAASIYKSVIAGMDSGIERSAINSWTDETSVNELLTYIKSFVHPHFVYNGFSYDGDRYVAVNPAVLVSTNELAIHMGLPRHSVRGLPVIEHAQFAQEIIRRNQSDGIGVRLGNIYHLGEKTNADMWFDLNSLAMHTFITGSTGSGKSNTVYKLLGELKKIGVSFLVIEPTKGEYKDVFGKHNDVRTFGTNPNLNDIYMLRINPFRFPKHIHILEHLDRLIEIFNVCWPMYAAMPAILKDSVERAYAECGWNLEKSINKYDPDLFPTFADVVKQIKIVLSESDYSEDNKGDYVGSLVTRLRSLTNGINGLIFTTDDISDAELFDHNAIVDLSRVGSSETKSLIMGLMVLKLQEYRMEQREQGANANDVLKHVTVLEEAHNLLKRTSTEQATEGANMLGKSVEMLANSIAEMRTYGEGFVIVDQAPGLLDMSVIRNTNTKVILRLPDLSDRELVGKSAGLNDSQIVELAKLEKGVAAVYQNDWIAAVLCKIDKFGDSDLIAWKKKQDRKLFCSSVDNEKISLLLLDCIMNKEIYRKGEKVDIQKLKQDIVRSKIETVVKCDFIKYVNAIKEETVETMRILAYDFLHASEAMDASKNCKDFQTWIHCVAEKLNPDIRIYSKEQIDLVMALLIYEQSLRDGSYCNILRKFTEIHREKGGVF